MDETTETTIEQTDSTAEQAPPNPHARLAIKTIHEDDAGVTVGGPLLLWGDNRRVDLQGEYFTPETRLWLEQYKSVPALFHHGMDPKVGLEVVGHRVKTEIAEDGVWVQDWIDKSTKYWALIEKLLKQGKLYYSPGSVPHLTKSADDGRLISWPIVEDTLTPTPAQFRLRAVEQIKAAYKAANLEPPTIEEPTGTGDEPSGDTEGSVCEDVPDGTEIERLRTEQQNRIALLNLEV